MKLTSSLIYVLYKIDHALSSFSLHSFISPLAAQHLSRFLFFIAALHFQGGAQRLLHAGCPD